MSLITIDRALVSQEQNPESVFATDEDSENAAEAGSKSSHSEDFFLRKTSAITLSVKSQRRISVVRDHDNLHEHLKRILQILRFNDYVKLIVKLENASPRPVWFRYLAVISSIGSQNTEESVIMGVDVYKGAVTLGFILPIYQDMVVALDGDGGFKLITRDNIRLFKPVSVQALWAAHQAIMLGCKVAQQNDYHSKGPSHAWVSYYTRLPSSKQFMMFEWNKMEDIEDMGRATPPTAELGTPVSEDERRNEDFKNSLRLHLQRIMGSVDLEDVNVVQLREMLEKQMGMSLKDQRQFIADQVLIIYGQMDVPSFIFDHLLLGSSFNASNGDELRRNNVTHIVNVTREVDNFFPADQFVYKNIRVYDDEKAQLLPYWDETFKFINEARANGTRCLVHCKMGISRSGSTVVAYAMKEKGWKLNDALEFVKSKRPCVNPNANFLRQLETYQGILEASAHRHSALFQQKDKPTEATGAVRPRVESPGVTTTLVREGEEEYDTFEPPPGPSGPVDLEAELFAFKSFPQFSRIQEELINVPQKPSELEGSPSGIRRRVLVTTSQRIRHWHPDVYEDVGSGGVVISRSKSSPTRLFQRRQPPTTTAPYLTVPLTSPPRSPLNPTITVPSIPVPPPDGEAGDGGVAENMGGVSVSSLSSPSSEAATSSVSEHDILLTPSFSSPQISNGDLTKDSLPKVPSVTITIVPSNSGFSEPPELPLSSSVSAVHPPTEFLRTSPPGRLTLSLFTMAPDEEQPHRPVRTLSLRLRPDDSWIVKRQASEEGDEVSKTIPKGRSFSEITPATTSSLTPLEEEVVVVEGEPRLEVVSATACSRLDLQNTMPAVIAASQH
ncbi:Protein phosphatase Slingshot -like protein 1 [Echinococcus granulosus]|nr:Protein phosphatase Slingshot -like protein 1 [Echinococcus granulosus]